MKSKRVCKESKYIHLKKYEVTLNRNVNKDNNKPNKEKYIKATNT